MKRGVVVLTPFPFTNLSGQKVRPALVVSRTDRMGSDVVLAFITSHADGTVLPTDLELLASHPNFRFTGLKRNSLVKLDKLITVEANIILGELGELTPDLLLDADEKLRFALAL